MTVRVPIHFVSDAAVAVGGTAFQGLAVDAGVFSRSRLPSRAFSGNREKTRTPGSEDDAMTTPLFNPCGGYRRLDAYAMANNVQLATLRFWGCTAYPTCRGSLEVKA